MYDAVNVEGIPSEAVMVAGYVNGLYSNLTQLDSRFPKALHIGISVSAHENTGLVLDVETGDASPSEAPAWVQMRRKEGVNPTVYCNASTWLAVKQAFYTAGVAEPNYWIADYDNDPTIPTGAIAKQYSSNSQYDVSSVADYWPGIDAEPNSGDNVALTQDDANLVVHTLLNTVVNETGDTPSGRTVLALLEWMDQHYENLYSKITTVESSLADVLTSLETQVNSAVESAMKNGITATIEVNGTVK
jgi:hypothetical protein